MQSEDNKAGQVETLLDTPDLAGALESEQFKRFLDQVPIAIAVSDLKGPEHIIYANPEFEKQAGITAAELDSKAWSALNGEGLGQQRGRPLADAIVEDSDCIGTYRMERAGAETAIVDAYSNVIESDDGTPCFRLLALVDVTAHEQVDREALEIESGRRTRCFSNCSIASRTTCR